MRSLQTNALSIANFDMFKKKKTSYRKDHLAQFALSRAHIISVYNHIFISPHAHIPSDVRVAFRYTHTHTIFSVACKNWPAASSQLLYLINHFISVDCRCVRWALLHIRVCVFWYSVAFLPFFSSRAHKKSTVH